MNNKDKIKYLSQYVNLVKEYQEAKESYDYYKYKLISVQAQTISDMPKGQANQDKIGNNVAKVDELETIIKDKLQKIEELRLQIEYIVNSIEDSVYRRLMSLRYIEGYKWEEICVKMNFSWAHTHRIHSNALNKLGNSMCSFNISIG